MAYAARPIDTHHSHQLACALCPECGEAYGTFELDIPGVSYVFFHSCADDSVSRRSARIGGGRAVRSGTRVPPFRR